MHSLTFNKIVAVLIFGIAFAVAVAHHEIRRELARIFRGDNDGPVVLVVTSYPGMPGGTVEKSITNRLEPWVNQAPGAKSISSRSLSGVSIIEVRFRPDIDTEGAVKITNSLAQGTLATLPPDTKPPLVIGIGRGNGGPVGMVVVRSTGLDEGRLRDVANVEVRNRLDKSSAYAVPVIVGGKDRTNRLCLDPKKLKARGLSPADVVDALKQGSIMFAPGTPYFSGNQVLIDINVVTKNVADLNDLPIRVKKADNVFLRDIGHAQEASVPQPTRVRIDGRPAVELPILPNMAASPSKAARAIRDALPDLTKHLPAGTKVDWIAFGPEFVTLYVRAPVQSSLSDTEKRVAEVERFLTDNIPAEERAAIISEIGISPNLSAAFTKNAGPQDATIRVQLADKHSTGAQDWVTKLRSLSKKNRAFADLEISFYVNPAAASPIDIRVEGGTIEQYEKVVAAIRDRVAKVPGAVDVFVQERTCPMVEIEIDRQKAAEVGLSAGDVTQQVVAALNSGMSIDRNSWIDAKSGNRSLVALPHPDDPKSWPADLDKVVAQGNKQGQKVKLSSLVRLRRQTKPLEVEHANGERVYRVRANVEDRAVDAVIADIKNAIQNDISLPAKMYVKVGRE
jgi:multidrug efflux pump subunit AcrB